MIIGIQETTDRNSPETRITRLGSLAHARRWLSDETSKLAWPGSVPASKGGDGPETIPISVQNLHHRLKDAYEMPHGWRMPTKREWLNLPHNHNDRRSFMTYQADKVRRFGTAIRLVVTAKIPPLDVRDSFDADHDPWVPGDDGRTL